MKTAKSIVCTLFEADYHNGVAALINSLSVRGFTGVVFVGYRGELPSWVLIRSSIAQSGCLSLALERFEVLFIEVPTGRSLTNLKPEFMLDVLGRVSGQTEYIFFFDADVFISAPWQFFEEWAQCGLALIADGNSPMPKNHPVRVAWRRHFTPHGFRFTVGNDYYFNGGFCGISRSRFWILDAWAKVQSIMAESVSLNLPISLPGAPEWQRLRTFPFYLTDQDALNIVADIEKVDISAIGSEGMGWKLPADYMQHACGGNKPWRGRYVRRALRGESPVNMDSLFWEHAAEPIALVPDHEIRRIKRHISIARRIAPIGAMLNVLRW